MTNIFNKKNIKPMLLREADPFNDENFIFELKLDGIRCLAYLDNNKTILRNKRNKDVTITYPELKNIHKQANKKCIIDGELIALTNNKPDFFKLQRRSLLGNKLKIKYTARLNPIQFVAYDIIFFDDENIMNLPLIKRKEILENNIKDSKRIVKSRFIEKKGIDFFELAKKEGLEGIIAKRKDSLYREKVRSYDWLKIKVMQEEDVVICGFTLKKGKIKDLILGQYDNKKLVYTGKIYFGISRFDNKTIKNFAKNNTLKKPIFNIKKKNVTWVKPELVGTIKYMHKTKSGGLRQPVFKGLRDDKQAKDCVVQNS
jgi:DNA ligase D-like protein (predicted ligase)